MRTKTFAAALVGCLLLSFPVFADDVVQPPVALTRPIDPLKDSITVGIRKGQPAPFSGVLLSPRAVADLIAKQDEIKKQAELDKQKALDEQKVQDDAKLKEAQVAADANATACDQRIKLRDDNLAKTEKDLVDARAKQSNPTTWLAVGGAIGAVVGTAVTVLIVGLVHGI